MNKWFLMENKLNIKITTDITIYTTTDFPYGGAAENLLRQMAIGLNAKNAHVKVILLRGHYLDKKINDTGIDCNCLLFKKRFRNELLKFLELILMILTIPFSIIRIRMNSKKAVILLYGVEYFYSVIPFILSAWIFGFKVYRIVTDRYPKKGIVPVWWKKSKYFFYRLQFTIFDKYLSGLICLSNYLKENAIKNGIKANKIIVIPHFIDVEYFSKKYSQIEPFQKENIRLGFCGTLNESNGLFVLIKAFRLILKKNSKMELFLIGAISEGDLIATNEIMDGMLDSIIFAGKVPSIKIPELLTTCDILINPRISSISAEAGFPTKLGEYFATKRPVVATAVGDLKNNLENENQLILVEPDSPQTLADGIIILLENHKQAIKIGLNGFHWAKTNLDYLSNATIMLTFLQKK